MENKIINIILEFSVVRSKAIIYRGVQASDGSYRMEKRGITAKRFKPYMWSGSIESLYFQREILLNKSKA